MAKRNTRPRIPTYTLHKRTGQARVRIDGKDIYLGTFNSPESRERYDRLIQEWLSNGRSLPSSRGELITIRSLTERFMDWAKVRYRRADGSIGNEVSTYKRATEELNGLYGSRPVEQFGPSNLRMVRDRMIRLGWRRSHINKQIHRLRAVFRWGVSRDLVSPDLLSRLTAVESIPIGTPDVKADKQTKLVSEDQVNKIKPHVSPQVWALLQLQLLTGARAGELVGLRPADIDMTGEVWSAELATHKTAHHGKTRTLCFGPGSQMILKPFLRNRVPMVPLFRPVEAERERLAKLHANRKTPEHYGNRPGTNRKENPERSPGETYTVASYRRAIQRAVSKVNKEAKKPEDRIEAFHPHALRHTALTRIRDQHGLEAAQAIGGHGSAAMTDRYTWRATSLARNVAAQAG